MISILLFYVVYKDQDVLSAVKKENIIMAGNVSHATIPVVLVQVPLWCVCLN